MQGIAVINLDSADGELLTPIVTSWTVEGKSIAGIGTNVQSHGKGSHTNAKMVTGSSWFTINGVPVCKAEDVASCGHPTTGRPWFTID